MVHGLQLNTAIDHCWPFLLRSLDRYGTLLLFNLFVLHLGSITSFALLLVKVSLVFFVSKLFSDLTFFLAQSKQSFSCLKYEG